MIYDWLWLWYVCVTWASLIRKIHIQDKLPESRRQEDDDENGGIQQIVRCAMKTVVAACEATIAKLCAECGGVCAEARLYSWNTRHQSLYKYISWAIWMCWSCLHLISDLVRGHFCTKPLEKNRHWHDLNFHSTPGKVQATWQPSIPFFQATLMVLQVPCAARLFRYLGLDALRRFKDWAATAQWTRHDWVRAEVPGEMRGWSMRPENKTPPGMMVI